MNLESDRKLVRGQLGRVADADRFLKAIAAFDTLNDDDPNRVAFGGREVGYELRFSVQLFARTLSLRPDASEPLMLAARSQHVCRWMIPREDYPRDRAGYLRWRADLKKFHAARSAETLAGAGYAAEVIDRVRSLNLKLSLKSDPECQTLEDALCLVFLEKQLASFSERAEEDKLVEILRKTWAKMSEPGRAAALALDLGDEQLRLVKRALAEPA